MRFGIWPFGAQPWDGVREIAAHCEQTGWDAVDEKRQVAPGQPVIIGTPAEVVDIIAAYRDAGADEIIIPDRTLGREMTRRKDTCDLFMQEVVAAFR